MPFYRRVTIKGGATGQKAVLKIVGNPDKFILGINVAIVVFITVMT